MPVNSWAETEWMGPRLSRDWQRAETTSSWAMRDIRKGNCPLCDHHEVVEAVPPEYGHGSGEIVSAVTAEPRWLMGGRNAQRHQGEFRVYFCRSCGYAQWFVLKPESVPISDDHRTKLIEGIKPDLYR